MSNPTRVGSVHYPPPVRVGLSDGELRWWVEWPAAAPATARPVAPASPYGAPPVAPVGGRIYREATGYIAESPCFLIGDRARTFASPLAAAVAAWRRETVMAPVADGVARAYGGRAAVFLMDGNEPSWPWPWAADGRVRPEGLTAWERAAVAAASAYRRFSIVLKDLDECRTWIVEARLGGVGIVRMALDPEDAPTRWLARHGVKQLLLAEVARN